MLSFLRRRGEELPTPREGRPVAFDIAQDGNKVTLRADGIETYFLVEGITLPAKVDASFAVWALLPMAMQEGFNLHVKQPIDPTVAANAELVSQIWEMWVPNLYRSVKVSGEGDWSRNPLGRRPIVQLFSGGIDSTFSILKNRRPLDSGFAVTVCGVDQTDESNIVQLVEKTEPLLNELNCERIVVRNNVHREPPALTIQFTLASSLFLLSDLFEQGTLAADSTVAEDMATFPWGTNHVTDAYLAGSDFSVRTIGAEARRTEKIATIASSGLDLHSLTFCRSRKVIPENCGVCRKCIRTKAMFLITTGGIPKIFLDNSFDESLMREMGKKYSDRVHLFDIYFYAKDRGLVDRIPGLGDLVEQCRVQGAQELAAKSKSQ
jgi:hypothetical protein